MAFQIKLAKCVEKSLDKLDRVPREKIIDFIYHKIQPNPFLLREPLHGTKKGLWKYRVGDYRIICEIKNSEFVVLVIDLGHRREIYN